MGNCTAVGVGVGGVTMVGTGCSLTKIWNHDRYQNEDITNVILCIWKDKYILPCCIAKSVVLFLSQD